MVQYAGAMATEIFENYVFVYPSVCDQFGKLGCFIRCGLVISMH